MLLQHGTTKDWAGDILKHGPDPYFKLPDDPSEDPEGFFTVSVDRPFERKIEGDFETGCPEDYARRKAKNFPDKGGAASLEFEIPDNIVNDFVGELDNDVEGKANNRDTEIWFGIDFSTGRDFGIQKLRKNWEQLFRRIILLQDQ